MTIISMENIRKVYDTGKVTVEALKGIDLHIGKGEMVAIVGPSGSGKSTLMNLVGCLDTPTSGKYELAGENVAGVTRDQLADIRNRRVGFVFQNFNLLPHITAQENVELPMLFGGIPSATRRERAAELLTRVGLGERLDHKPTELSGGQMQRVAIARALAMDPDIVLADEPTGNLDSSAGTDISSLFEDLWKAGRTVVVITHDPALAKRAGRTVEIRDGRITADQTAAACARRQRSSPASGSGTFRAYSRHRRARCRSVCVKASRRGVSFEDRKYFGKTSSMCSMRDGIGHVPG